MPIELLQFLPALYHEHPFVRTFLEPFDTILQGLESKIAEIVTYIDPAVARAEFLPWLAGWVGITSHVELSEIKQRKFIANIMHYYRRRGTKQNLKDLLELFTGETAVVTDDDIPDFQVGEHSTIGIDSYIGGPLPYCFKVRLSLPGRPTGSSEDDEYRRRLKALARAVIEAEKPAYTDYSLEVTTDETERGAGRHQER
jgi:phage tail-like protein